MLILVGSGRDRLRRGRPPGRGHRDRVARLRHRGRRVRHRGQPRRLARTSTAAPRRPTRPRSRATPRTCAPTPTPRSACSSASRWSSITGATWIDPVVALVIAVAIVYTGLKVVAGSWRVLVDEALPEEETRRSARRSSPSARAASPATTSSAPAARGRAATSTSTSSSAPARRSRPPTRSPTSSRTRSATRLRGADVLIHLEPEDRVRPGEEVGVARERGLGNGALREGVRSAAAAPIVLPLVHLPARGRTTVSKPPTPAGR